MTKIVKSMETTNERKANSTVRRISGCFSIKGAIKNGDETMDNADAIANIEFSLSVSLIVSSIKETNEGHIAEYP